LAVNPFLWLTSRERWKPILVWGFLAVCAVLWLLDWWHWRKLWLDQITCVFTGLVLGAVLKVWMTSEASWQLAADRRSGALELLLVTPLSEREICRGQWLGICIRGLSERAALWVWFSVSLVADLVALSRAVPQLRKGFRRAGYYP
jgi:hypothetical protein